MLESQINFENNNLNLQTSNITQKLRFGHIRGKKVLSELEDYDLKQTIGEGGFGKVKKAVHKLTGSLVAIKIINNKAKNTQETADLEKQINIQKHILHENIAQVYEVIKKQNKIYIIMQYCKNGELFTFINKNGPLSEKHAGKIFNQILSALIYLRDNQICHRDIKPENIMFDENWNVKLIDFGFSCRETHEEMRTTYCGTPSYNAPEMVKKLPYTGEATDVWSLGVTLYAMLAAELPFEDENQAVKKNKVVNCKYLIKPFFSARVQKLFSLIFVEANKRINLLNLKNHNFLNLTKVVNQGLLILKCKILFWSKQYQIEYKNSMILIQKKLLKV